MLKGNGHYERPLCIYPMHILEIFTECLAEVLDSSANAVGTSVGCYLRLLRRYRKVRSPSSPTLLHTSRDLLSPWPGHHEGRSVKQSRVSSLQLGASNGHCRRELHANSHLHVANGVQIFVDFNFVTQTGPRK